MDNYVSLPPSSIVIVSYNSASFLPACLESVLALDYPEVEVIVVDNASADDSAQVVRSRFPQVSLIASDRNLGFAGGANAGLRAARGQILCVLNPDVVLRADWLKEIASALLRDDEAGIAGSKLLYPDGRTIQHAGGELQRPEAVTKHTGYGETDQGQYDEIRECDFVTGAAMAAKREVLERLDYFDESFFPAYFEEPDLCLRAKRAGYKTIYVPTAVAIHHESATLSMRSEEYFRLHHTNRLRFVAKHWSSDDLFGGFVSAESVRLCDTMPDADRSGSAQAYRNSLADSEGEQSVGNKASARPMVHRTEAQGHRLEVMRSSWLVKERPFSSRTPVAGRLLVFLRTKFNNFATRWYIQPMLQQQDQFNEAVYRSLEETDRELENFDQVLVMHNAVVKERMKRIEERMERVEHLLEILVREQNSTK